MEAISNPRSMIQNCIKNPQRRAITITPSSNLIYPHRFHAIKNSMETNREARILEIARKMVKTTRKSHELEGWVTSASLLGHHAMGHFTPIAVVGGFKASYSKKIAESEECEYTEEAARQSSAHNLAPTMSQRSNNQYITCNVLDLMSRKRN